MVVQGPPKPLAWVRFLPPLPKEQDIIYLVFLYKKRESWSGSPLHRSGVFRPGMVLHPEEMEVTAEPQGSTRQDCTDRSDGYGATTITGDFQRSPVLEIVRVKHWTLTFDWGNYLLGEWLPTLHIYIISYLAIFVNIKQKQAIYLDKRHFLYYTHIF